jgi:hypothetical protein
MDGAADGDDFDFIVGARESISGLMHVVESTEEIIERLGSRPWHSDLVRLTEISNVEHEKRARCFVARVTKRLLAFVSKSVDNSYGWGEIAVCDENRRYQIDAWRGKQQPNR